MRGQLSGPDVLQQMRQIAEAPFGVNEARAFSTDLSISNQLHVSFPGGWIWLTANARPRPRGACECLPVSNRVRRAIRPYAPPAAGPGDPACPRAHPEAEPV